MAFLLPKSAFIHIPRTGGTWVRLALVSSGMKKRESGLGKDYGVKTIHHTIEQAQEWIEGRKTFSFIRHPVTYLRSRWLKGHFPPLTKRGIDVNAVPNFTEFIELYLQWCPGWISGLFSNFTGWNWDGTYKKHKVDYIGRLENQPWDLWEALIRCGECPKIPEAILREPPRHVAKKETGTIEKEIPMKLFKKVIDAERYARFMGYGLRESIELCNGNLYGGMNAGVSL